MRTRWTLALVALPLLLAADKKLEFKEYTSKDHNFTLKMPGTVKTMNQKVGDLLITNYMVEIDNSTVFMVAVSDYAAGTVKEGKEDELLDGSRDGIVGSLKGKVLKEDKIKLDNKYIGRELQVECPGIGIYRTRLFLVGDRLYQVVVLASKEISTSKDADGYLESFKLSK